VQTTLRSVLVTCFDPFGSHSVNISEQVGKQLVGWKYPRTVLHVQCLPTSYQRSFTQLRQALETIQPTVIVALGQATGRPLASLETQASNIIDNSLPDNDGFVFQNKRLESNGPDRYPSTLPIETIMAAWQKAKIPHERSSNAGTYVCNALFYRMMHWCAQNMSTSKAGFLHLSGTQVEAPQVSELDVMAHAVCIALEATLGV
jgi:pyroglutamyl-peptidase